MNFTHPQLQNTGPSPPPTIGRREAVNFAGEWGLEEQYFSEVLLYV